MNKQQLIESLKAKGFSKKIIQAFSKVQRENFIPERLKNHAYEDTALPIGQEQTISQPYTIAMMLSLLEIKNNQKTLKNQRFLAPQKQEVFKVLEVGSGCGYVLALLSEMCPNAKIYGIEIIKELAGKSRENLKNSGYKNIEVYNKNGTDGLPEKAPFDRILVSAACKEIPKNLFMQLKENGIVVAPVDSILDSYVQDLVAIKKTKNKSQIIKQIPGFVFVRFVER